MEATPKYYVLSFGDGKNLVLQNSLGGEGQGWE